MESFFVFQFQGGGGGGGGRRGEGWEEGCFFCVWGGE